MPSVHSHEYIRCSCTEMGGRQELAVYRSCHQVKQPHMKASAILIHVKNRNRSQSSSSFPHQTTNREARTRDLEQTPCMDDMLQSGSVHCNAIRKAVHHQGRLVRIMNNSCTAHTQRNFLVLCVTLRSGIRSPSITLL
jgi:hypothetical protein